MSSPLIEVSESFVKILEDGGATDLPVMDVVVEGIRHCLRQGYDVFQKSVEKEFINRLEGPSLSKRLLEKFYRTNHLRLAELVLLEREVR